MKRARHIAPSVHQRRFSSLIRSVMRVMRGYLFNLCERLVEIFVFEQRVDRRVERIALVGGQGRRELAAPLTRPERNASTTFLPSSVRAATPAAAVVRVLHLVIRSLRAASRTPRLTEGMLVPSCSASSWR